ncbi:hypothetical protein [Moorena producens]|uniref:hypothetical protein n=1 Tax=Moorena producens TaxID=1155739 RepID=UPI0011EA6803|nr:hypothetical protein [Moorena producens]
MHLDRLIRVYPVLLRFKSIPQEIPGYFRISLTASEEMISSALPKFQAAFQDAIASIDTPQSS